MERKVLKNTQRIFYGALVGTANSLFGGGGGMLAVPLLKNTGLDDKCAHATAILLILPVSMLSFILYYFRGFYNVAVVIPTAIGVVAGGLVGAKLLGVLPVKAVQITFAFLQLLAGIFLFFF